MKIINIGLSIISFRYNFMKQPASISELCRDKAYRPMQRSNLMLVF